MDCHVGLVTKSRKIDFGDKKFVFKFVTKIQFQHFGDKLRLYHLLFFLAK